MNALEGIVSDNSNLGILEAYEFTIDANYKF
jgi:hypothetical protein